MKIDAHVHYMPPALADALDDFAAEEPFWALMMAGVSPGRSIQGWATAERMIADMDQAGIDRVVLMGEYRQQQRLCASRNDQAIALVRRWPERISAFAVLQPKAGQAALDELARCLDAGLTGVGELGPYGQGYRLDDPDFLRLVEACIRYDIPLNLHTNEEVGRFYPGKATTPLLHYYGLAQRYPELKLILAHWGGGLFFYELMPEVRRTLRNVWYDTAGSPLLFATPAIFQVALQCVDPHKLLYASDYPLRLYPKTQREPDFRPFLVEIEALGLPADVESAVLGDNAARLLGVRVAGGRESGRPLGGNQGVTIPLRGTQVAPSPQSPIPDSPSPISAHLAVAAVAAAWPATAAIFEKYGIPWHDSPVPYWEPILQAAAARGLGPEARARLLAELNEAAGW